MRLNLTLVELPPHLRVNPNSNHLDRAPNLKLSSYRIVNPKPNRLDHVPKPKLRKNITSP